MQANGWDAQTCPKAVFGNLFPRVWIIFWSLLLCQLEMGLECIYRKIIGEVMHLFVLSFLACTDFPCHIMLLSYLCFHLSHFSGWDFNFF